MRHEKKTLYTQTHRDSERERDGKSVQQVAECLLCVCVCMCACCALYVYVGVCVWVSTLNEKVRQHVALVLKSHKNPETTNICGTNNNK